MPWHSGWACSLALRCTEVQSLTTPEEYHERALSSTYAPGAELLECRFNKTTHHPKPLGETATRDPYVRVSPPSDRLARNCHRYSRQSDPKSPKRKKRVIPKTKYLPRSPPTPFPLQPGPYTAGEMKGERFIYDLTAGEDGPRCLNRSPHFFCRYHSRHLISRRSQLSPSTGPNRFRCYKDAHSSSCDGVKPGKSCADMPGGRKARCSNVSRASL